MMVFFSVKYSTFDCTYGFVLRLKCLYGWISVCISFISWYFGVDGSPIEWVVWVPPMMDLGHDTPGPLVIGLVSGFLLSVLVAFDYSNSFSYVSTYIV